MPLHLQVVTPQKLTVDRDVDEVTIPGEMGELGVLPGHSPLLTLLKIGILRYRVGSDWQEFAVNQGYAEVFADGVAVVTDTCETSSEIDLERALESKRRAEERLATMATIDADFRRAERSLHRAESRILLSKTSGKPQSH
ncbi:MAG: F0F1 ATP synthase subunit epsilon [Myxococcales bacterium]|nr:F0F1 ATP synthase subunit epsilon [Myxococcales bacterium]